VEEWRDIPGFNGDFQASSLGQIRSLTRTVMTKRGPWVYKGKVRKQTSFLGYLVVSISLSKTSIRYLSHRLICLAFNGVPKDGMEVNHVNGKKDDNRIENLEWSTHKDNVQHAFDTGLNRGAKGSLAHNAILDEHDVIGIKTYLKYGFMQKDIAEIYGVSPEVISGIKNKRKWKHVVQAYGN